MKTQNTTVAESPSAQYQSAERLLRTVRFAPYIKRADLPTFTLKTWDTYAMTGGKCRLAYQLRMHLGGNTSVLFDGADFGCSPMHAIDSDKCVRSLMGFLTLRPGDTDADYFDNYTDAQREYCAQWAESLSCCVMDRFSPEER